MKKTFAILLYTFLPIYVLCQATYPNKLEVGKEVPDLTFKTVTNSKEDRFSLRDSNYDLILLDFWSIDCYQCIYALPEMVKFQKKFKDRIKIVAVTRNSQKEIDSTYKSLINVLPSGVTESQKMIPFVLQDTVLESLFPHPDGLPIHVWITKNSIYAASAFSSTTTENNISLFINGTIPDLASYYINDVNAHNLSSWFDIRFPHATEVKSNSILTGFDAKTKAGGYVFLGQDRKTRLINQIVCLNKSIPELYQVAYYGKIDRGTNTLTFDKIDLETLYPSYKIPELIHVWNNKNRFCYSQQSFYMDSLSFYNKMKFELDSYFGFSSRIDSLPIRCFILRETPEINKYKTKGEQYNIKESLQNNKTVVKFTNCSMDDIYNRIFSFVSRGRYPQKFLNETTSSGRFDFTVIIDSLDGFNHSLQKEFGKFGLNITEGIRTQKTILITPS